MSLTRLFIRSNTHRLVAEVEVNGLSSKSLFELAELLCKEFSQKTVLVKNFNTNKMYLVDFDEPSA